MSEFDWFTTVIDEFDKEILKAGFHMAIKKYPKGVLMEGLIDANFWEKYSGIDKVKSKQINEILVKSVLSGKWKDKEYLVRAIAALGVPYRQAETIARTELANLANRIRELAYREWTKVQKFVWVTERDDNVCEKCREVANRTANGVSLEELKKIIKDVGGEGARDFIVHVNCRCSFTRYWGGGRIRIRYWE